MWILLGDPARPERELVWDAEKGAKLAESKTVDVLLTPEELALFNRHFGYPAAENPKDALARREKQVEASAARRPTPRQHTSRHGLGKQQIRNDFAHYNIVNSARKRVNLTYLTNAVRSLLSYDRKLKNAVSKAIADIVYEDRLVIEWDMIGDRLKHPRVLPKMETHLSMVRPPAGLPDPRFKLPQASIRYTSMVKALFDFDQGGYRDLVLVHEKGKSERKHRGKLDYPQELLAKRYPEEDAIFEFESHPALPEET